MDAVQGMYSAYGETPDQSQIQTEGNKYLQARFPKLTYFTGTSIVNGAQAAPAQPQPMAQPQPWH